MKNGKGDTIFREKNRPKWNLKLNIMIHIRLPRVNSMGVKFVNYYYSCSEYALMLQYFKNIFI